MHAGRAGVDVPFGRIYRAFRYIDRTDDRSVGVSGASSGTLTPTTMVLFGYLVSSVTAEEFHWPFTTVWVIFMIVAALVIAGLNFRGVVVSAGTGTVLGALEIIVFLVLAIWLIVKAGSANTGSVFTLHYATIKGYSGFSGVVAGSIYTILAFIGFEAAAPLAEEARNPRRTIGIAVVTSCLCASRARSSTGSCTWWYPSWASSRSCPPGSPRSVSARPC
jgi:amino acid transporter